jgi:hypothetical protein
VITFAALSGSKRLSATNKPAKTFVQPTNLIKIGEAYLVGAQAKAILYATKPIETGYNEFAISLLDSIYGDPLTVGSLTVTPTMKMEQITHSAPVENPLDHVTATGYFKAAVVFTMPGVEWSLQLTFKNQKNGLVGKGTISVVAVSGEPTLFRKTVLAKDGNKTVYISLLQPKSPSMGSNDFEITLHEEAGPMNFPPITNYTVEVNPEMPSMGHGSRDNINPVHISNGHYVGKVTFSMTGLWKVKLKLYKNGSLISDDQFFEITVIK